MTLYGYGKILDVDLSTEEIVRRDVDPAFAREYIGGMGFSCKILYDEVGPDVDPFDPGNLLIFANGPLTGTIAPCSGRTEVTTKSPLTGSIGTGNTGGMWGTRLKHAGFDVIVIRNKANIPVYLWIDDDVVELRGATHLWGKDTTSTTDMLCQELDPLIPSKISVLTIGPAGENLVRYACPINDYHHAAARTGAGAVMGAKKLKAIAVRGTGAVKIAQHKEFKEAVREARARLQESASKRTHTHDNVVRNVIQDNQARGCWPHKNFQTGVIPQHWVNNLDRDAAMEFYTKKEGTCYSCPISCFNLVEVNDGKYRGVKVSRGTHPGVVSEWAGKCAINTLPAIWKCKEVCHQLGMDYVSAAGTIAFAMELFQRGIITAKDTDGLELDWGDEDRVVQMLHNIAFREGFGDVLAEGSAKAASRIGKGAEHYVMTIKGLEKMSSDPRSAMKGWIIGDLVNPRGGDNLKNTHFQADYYNPNWWINKFDMPEDVKKRIYSVPPEEISSTWEGKPLMCKWFEDLYSVLNALGLCFFPSGFNLALGPTHLSKMFSACTGWKTSPEDITKLGEKVFTVMKAYTIRQGMTRQDDTWPDRFYNEPLPEGPAKGMILSREIINQVLDEYYELRGWDKRFGLPTEQKLSELGLRDIANDLIERGKLEGKDTTL